MSQLVSHAHIDNICHTRQFMLDIISALDNSMLNKIPDGFNNNIIWNVAHLISSQYGICYLRSNNEIPDLEIFHSFKVGSKPERIISDEEIEYIKSLLFTSLDVLKADFTSGKLDNYAPWTTRYGVEIKNIQDGIAFLPYHEGLHLGYIMALKRVIAQAP